MFIPYKLYLAYGISVVTNPLLAIVIGAVVGALAVWTLTFSGLPVRGLDGRPPRHVLRGSGGYQQHGTADRA